MFANAPVPITMLKRYVAPAASVVTSAITSLPAMAELLVAVTVGAVPVPADTVVVTANASDPTRARPVPTSTMSAPVVAEMEELEGATAAEQGQAWQLRFAEGLV